MFGIFSGSSSGRRRPNPHLGGNYYQRGGMFGGLGSRSSSGKSYYPPYPQQGYPQGYPPPAQGYPQQPVSGYPQQPPVQGGFPQPAPVQTPATPPAQPYSPAAVCPQCGASVPQGSKFCLSCGVKMAGPAVCAGCGKPLPANAKFCPECGCPVR